MPAFAVLCILRDCPLTPSGMAHGFKTVSNLTSPPEDTMFASNDANPATVNRKKQKRRQKQAAKQAAQDIPASALPHQMTTSHPQSNHNADSDKTRSHIPGRTVSGTSTSAQRGSTHEEEDDYDTEDDDDATLSYAPSGHHSNGTLVQPADVPGKKKSRKKKKGKTGQLAAGEQQHESHGHHGGMEHNHANRPPGNGNKDRIWNTSTQEERERIKDFWQDLREEERKSLVKIEKDAVLRKMKEQQKHSCNCSLCGRKRNAIEEELEVLYDEYYDELEHIAYETGPGEHSYGNSTREGLRQAPRTLSHRTPVPLPGPQSQNQEPSEYDDEEELDYADDAEYSDDEEEDDQYSQESDSLREVANDFLQLGNSLTVKGPFEGWPLLPQIIADTSQGGILTVADDLLRNDGRKFIEMMEQMAERRMQREQEAYTQSQLPYTGHDHGPQEEEDFDEEEGEEYDSQEDEDDELEEPVITRHIIMANG